MRRAYLVDKSYPKYRQNNKSSPKIEVFGTPHITDLQSEFTSGITYEQLPIINVIEPCKHTASYSSMI